MRCSIAIWRFPFPSMNRNSYKRRVRSVRLQTYRQAELESGSSGQRNRPRVQFIKEAGASMASVDKGWEKRIQALEKALKSTPPVDYARPPYHSSLNNPSPASSFQQRWPPRPYPPQEPRPVSQDA